jgi:hypothetical protein
VWDEYNVARKKEYDVESINGALPLEVIESLPDPIPMTENEDWSYVTSTTRPRAPHLDPGQDPVLLLFVERALRIQTLELQADVASTAQLYDIGQSVCSEDQRQMFDHKAYANFFTVPDDPPPITRGDLQSIPMIVVEEAQDIPTIIIGDATPEGATISIDIDDDNTS